jgi:chromosome segregation ATPase
MEQEQIVKRIEWLDEERRKDKTTLATLIDRMDKLEMNMPTLEKQLREVGGDMVRLEAMLARLDQFEANMAQMRVEFNRSLEAVEKGRADHERELDKAHRLEMQGVNQDIGEIRKGMAPIAELKKGLQSRVEEDFRLSRLIEEMEQKVVEAGRFEEEYKRSLRLLEEGRRQDSKRLTDMLGEVTALRKRADEQRGKADLTADNLRKLETRLGELLAAESERKQAQTAFLEKQNLLQVERERTWKDWQARFDTVEKQAVNLDAQIQAMDATHRSVKRSQEALDEVTQRIDRRINEVTEMQRLSEDRFRQEWVTFKADDQKRWTNYTLAQEEQGRELNRQFEKFMERIVSLEDAAQDVQDMLQQGNEETEKRLQGILAMAHEWMAAYERAMGRTRT